MSDEEHRARYASPSWARQRVSVASRSSGKRTFAHTRSDLLFLTSCVNGKTVNTPLFSPSY
jgi:hypothetical protein